MFLASQKQTSLYTSNSNSITPSGYPADINFVQTVKH